jgi:hypothetical protein|tara:strand:- start:5315 stop:5545 length:231 start_codon:yes stop_codon:yes gene_type:complete
LIVLFAENQKNQYTQSSQRDTLLIRVASLIFKLKREQKEVTHKNFGIRTTLRTGITVKLSNEFSYLVNGHGIYDRY